MQIKFKVNLDKMQQKKTGGAKGAESPDSGGHTEKIDPHMPVK